MNLVTVFFMFLNGDYSNFFFYQRDHSNFDTDVLKGSLRRVGGSVIHGNR